MIQTLKVTESGSRIDAYIANNIPDISRSYSGQLLDDGRVKVSGVNKLKASYKVCEGDIIEIDIPDPVMTETKPQDIPLDIVYEDDDLIIINKPQGMVVHPACGHHEDTLVNALLHHCEGRLSDINGVIRPGIVHRIDKDTSGLLQDLWLLLRIMRLIRLLLTCLPDTRLSDSIVVLFMELLDLIRVQLMLQLADLLQTEER